MNGEFVTAMQELISLLDGRGVEYETDAHGAPVWSVGDSRAYLQEMGVGLGCALTLYPVTPKQAIAATLGADDTYTREDVEGAFVSGYSLGLDMFDSSKQEKGWNQNERNMDEEMEDLGWVRKDAATLGAGTCHNVHEPPKDTTFWPSPHFKCSECGATHVSMEYVFYCPNCGRHIVEVDE